MKINRALSWLCGLICLFAFPLTATAQGVPPLLGHQGRLIDAENQPVLGLQTLTFRVYDAADDAGTELWVESLDVDLSNGYYSAILGQTSALPDSVFDGTTRYLGVTVGDAMAAEELRPRLEITSVAYALKAGVAENATGALTPESIQLGNGSTTLNSDGSVNVGGASIASDGTIALGAATINTDGSIVVGDTTINPDGSMTVNGILVIAADGSIDSSAISGTTLSSLDASCAQDQIPQFDAVNGWGCVSLNAIETTYAAGSGLALDPTTNIFSLDSSVVQSPVTGTCPAGSAINAIAADGSVTCETDDDTSYTAGAGIAITGGAISLTDTVDDDTQYNAGVGLDLDGTTNTFNVNQTQIEAWANAVDDDTQYAEGFGLALAGTTFSVDTTAVQARVTGTCPVGEVLFQINADGTVACRTDADTIYTDVDAENAIASADTYVRKAGDTLTGPLDGTEFCLGSDCITDWPVIVDVTNLVSATCVPTSGSEPSCPADDTLNAIAGVSPNTRAINYRAASVASKSYTHVFDLAAEHAIDRIDLIGWSTGCWAEDGLLGCASPHNDNSFSFSVSSDNVTYTPITATASESCSRLDDGCWVAFDRIRFRYLQLTVNSGCSGCTNNDFVHYIKFSGSMTR